LTFLLGAHDRIPEPFPALPYSDVANFVSELRADGGVDALALEFLILTASRVSTVLGAVWSEIDWQAAVWTIPREKMKNRKDDHDVPLGPRAVAILRAMEQIKSSDRIFLVSRIAMWRLLKAKHPDVSVHGFRSCFKDAASDILGADDELSELALHHTVGSKTRRSYRRGKALQRRRELMLWWEMFLPDALSGERRADGQDWMTFAIVGNEGLHCRPPFSSVTLPQIPMVATHSTAFGDQTISLTSESYVTAKTGSRGLYISSPHVWGAKMDRGRLLR
jgi:hypothetical protein